MKYLEIIELRSVNHQKKQLEVELKTLINELNEKYKNVKIKLYNHISIDTDFGIHIHYDNKEIIIDKNSIGIQIAALLKDLGLVNHSVWIEMQDIKYNKKGGIKN